MTKMLYDLLRKAFTLGIAGTVVMAGTSDRAITDAVGAMERELGLTISWHFNLETSIRRTFQVPTSHGLFGPAISPDGTAVAWSEQPVPYQGEKLPFVTVETVTEGKQAVSLEGRIALHAIGISSGGETIVTIARRLDGLQSSPSELLVIDRRSSAIVKDLTSYISEFQIGVNVEHISVSGLGTLVAVGTRQKMQVLEIRSGKTVFAGPGRFPQLSPDGKRLAFVDNDKLLVHSFESDTTSQVVKGTRVKGIGGWSPDGRFLLAGAWTKMLALEKRQIIVDVTKNEYAVIGKLGEGDYGSQYSWVSTKFATR